MPAEFREKWVRHQQQLDQLLRKLNKYADIAYQEDAYDEGYNTMDDNQHFY
eukprot:UN01540